jgi:hypothetical protein
MSTKIAYKEFNEDLDAVLAAQKQDPLAKYSIEIEGEMKSLPALRVLEVIDGLKSFTEKAQLVKELLQGCKITINKDGKKTFEVGMTPGVEWWAVEGFNQDPLALRFLVSSVFTRFLKKYVA